ncbi:MAG: DEAD/DEAH box helicase [Lachnospiraceae bacterium]|nr:DEAD/DEAH box helicase [Lachnospiraceae bacterium]
MKIEKTEFARFNLKEETLDTLEMLGYLQMTPIQEQVIPRILDGCDVVGKSQTGSGKTAAFGIPICDQVQWKENAPQALILEPTRELAVQVREELFQIGRKRRIKIPVVFGGMPIDKELLSLKQKSHIVVGTPGRVMDHVRRGSLELSKIHFLIIDEADLMLDMGFIDEVKEIITHVQESSAQVVRALFSATMQEHVVDLWKAYMPEAVQVTVESETETVSSIYQCAYEVENEEKFQVLMKLLQRENPADCMIFCETREMVNTLFQKLRRKGIRCGMLHGGMEQRDRLYAIGDFRQGKFHLFITTDVAARGIDFPDITHVINYDFPTKKENYVHRIGRTARNGKSGTAISLIQPEEKRAQQEAERYSGVTIKLRDKAELQVAEAQQRTFAKRQKEKVILKEGKGAVFKESITKLTIGGGKKSKMRAGDVVGTICSIDGVSADDIGIIDVRDSITYVELLNGKGARVYEILQKKPIKGKLRKIQKTDR